ncbi:MAG: site-specific DNA-methyltransferase [Candidatus Brocadia sapporoensis]|nr:MAG: site-specific DNA-methyltransferase [Candidatus Brocadia sapporoensis]
MIEDPEKSYGDKNSENMLIYGDNLLALKALEQDFAGKIKCIYIDPPYNTGNAFEHYDDGLEHSIWLSLMRDRLVVLKNLLSPDGLICCHIDDSEGHYLKVLMDEIFERSNYLTTLYIQVRYPEKTLKQDMDYHKEIEQIHVYRKKYGAKPNLNEKQGSFDKFNFYVEELGAGTETTLGGKKVFIFKKGEYRIVQKEGSALGLKEIWATGTILDGNSSGRFFRDYFSGRVEQDGLGVLYKVYGIGDDSFGYRYFTGPQRTGATKGKYYQGVPKSQLENPELKQTTPIENFYDLAGSFGNCRTEGSVDFRGGKKPEILIHRILSHFSNPGDIVLDSFLGSGTTAAVAHKMNRRWIGIELGEHCHTHCLPRLRKVVDGTDQGGISKIVHTPGSSQVRNEPTPSPSQEGNKKVPSSEGKQGWVGGGGFKYYYLAPSLLKKDKHDNWIIDERYNADMLAAAMAKHEGFRYCPDEHIYWKQGRSTEKDYIFITTQFVTVQFLDKIREEMKPDESLLICCKSFQEACENRYTNITIKKIPKMLLGRCEFGKEDYSLNIVNLPEPTPDPSQEGNLKKETSQEGNLKKNPSQEGNSNTENSPLSGNTESPLLGGDLGVGNTGGDAGVDKSGKGKKPQKDNNSRSHNKQRKLFE